MINYWIVLLIFAVFLGLILGQEGYPESFKKFILNFLALTNSYNGAWWFLFTYILLTFISSFLFKILDTSNKFRFLFIILLLYFVSFYFSVYNNLFRNAYVGWLFKQFYLFGTSLFPLLIGAMALKEKWNIKIT